MVPLRLVAIASNVALMSYLLLGLEFGIFGRLIRSSPSMRRCSP
jgi:hypothetical protein